MKLRSTPALATWLLRLFCSSAEYESAVGDLLEQYQLGHNRIWYWRQVMSIVAFGLFRKAIEQKLAVIFLLGSILAAAICTWTLLMILEIGGVFATISNGSDGPQDSNWIGLLFFVGQIAMASLYFFADRRKRKHSAEVKRATIMWK